MRLTGTRIRNIGTGLLLLAAFSCVEFTPDEPMDPRTGDAPPDQAAAPEDLATADLTAAADLRLDPDLRAPRDLMPRAWPPLTTLKFAPFVSYPAGTTPRAVTTADFNRDGLPDVATANDGSDNVSVFLGNGDGTLQAAQPFAVGQTPRTIVSRDMNNDGIADLITPGLNTSSVDILLGKGDGTFQPKRSFGPTKPDGVVVADLNKDGKLDVATVGYGSGHVDVFLGDGTGALTLVSTPTPGGDTLSKGVALDCNGDGKLDLGITSGSGTPYTSLGALIGNGDGTFGVGPTFRNNSGGPGTHGVDARDLNGDGKIDVLLPGNAVNAVAVLLGNGDCSFSTGPTVSTGAGSTPHGVRLGDIDLDGKLDMITANRGTDAIGVFLGKGDGSFVSAPAQGSGAGSQPEDVTLADLDLDGRLDIISANAQGNSVSVLLNQSTY